MNGVLGMLGILLDGNLTPAQRDCVVTLQRSADSLLTVLNDILDFSKMEAGRLNLQPSAFSLCKEIEQVVQLFAEGAQQKGLELSCEIEADVPHTVIGDGGRFRQILANLLSNAIKFSEHGEVTVRATQDRRNERTTRVRLEVADNGVGIAEEARGSLFQAFVQVDGSATRRHEGTGLGLAISKELLELMGGRIGFDSWLGIGSTFWFEVPLEVASDSAAVITSDSLRGLRILIVDDTCRRRAAMVRTLEAWGMITWQAVCETETLNALGDVCSRGEQFDIVLVSLRPEERGIELARAIADRVSPKPPPVLLLTSMRQRLLSESMVAGSGACLIKPPGREELFVGIAILCGRVATPARTNTNSCNKPGKQSGRALSVLVAEDNHINQRVLTALLSRLGHTFDVVGDGAAAIEAAKRSCYDVVLMDCQMPRVDGFEATAEIRRLPGSTGRVRIVAITANAMPGDRERCLAVGMDDYVAKPVRLEQLAQVLNEATPEPIPY